jgi:hypothetical protein
VRVLFFILFLVGCSIAPVEPAHVDKEAFRNVVEQNIRSVRACYEAELKAAPKLAGKMVFDWQISADGRVTKASLNDNRSTLHNSKMADCIVGLIKSWKFPAVPKDNVLDITFPFTFDN